tara:strand:- start:419 stop:886 length:468 start_codon:yes stop_codon:yes gene_type:complete
LLQAIGETVVRHITGHRFLNIGQFSDGLKLLVVVFEHLGLTVLYLVRGKLVVEQNGEHIFGAQGIFTVMIEDFLYRGKDFDGVVSLGLGTRIINVAPVDILPFQLHHIGKVHSPGVKTKDKIVFAVQKYWIVGKVKIDDPFDLFKGKGPFGAPSL